MKSRAKEFIELFEQDPIYHKRMDNVAPSHKIRPSVWVCPDRR